VLTGGCRWPNGQTVLAGNSRRGSPLCFGGIPISLPFPAWLKLLQRIEPVPVCRRAALLNDLAAPGRMAVYRRLAQGILPVDLLSGIDGDHRRHAQTIDARNKLKQLTL
jgi:hypothetical protein